MRSIGSNRITGPEAILVIAVMWWLKRRGGVLDDVLEALREVQPFPATRVDLKLGREFLDGTLSYHLRTEFWSIAGSDPSVRYFVEEATRAQKGQDLQEKMAVTRVFVEKLISTEIGMAVKERLLKEHSSRIRKVKRERRKRKSASSGA